MKESKRTYKMTTRADQAAATRRRILESAIEISIEHPGEPYTLEAIAHRADTSVRTILRNFGSRDGLQLAAFALTTQSGEKRGHGKPVHPGDVDGNIRVLIDDYEDIGDMVVTQLAEEHKVAGLKEALDIGRKNHRGWVEDAFQPQVDRLTDDKREQAILSLIAATDVYVWKLLRRDHLVSRESVQEIIIGMIKSILGGD